MELDGECDVLSDFDDVVVVPVKMSKWRTHSKPGEILFTVNENPPAFTCLALGMQHFLTMVVGTISMTLFITSQMCLENNLQIKTDILSTVFVVMGISTLIQSTCGVRLPIVQGATASVLLPTLATMKMPDLLPCPDLLNSTIGFNDTANPDSLLPWQQRLVRINGLIICSALFQMFIGFAGIPSLLVRFIGPLTIAPVIALIGLGLFQEVNNFAQHQWWITLTTVALIIIFTFVLESYNVPFPAYSRDKGFHAVWFGLFRMCPVILGIGTAWILSAILTASGAFPSDPNQLGYLARTDVKSTIIREADWFIFPYPGRFGWPKPILAPLLGFFAGALASIFESVGDYYVTARVAKAPSPPGFSVNRGIFIEGVGCFLSGLFGAPVATTSFSDNIGAIGITKVASRRVVQYTGFICIFLGLFQKFSAIFVSIPEPVIGGVYLALFGLLTGIGLSSLQCVNLNSSRNVFILGISLFIGFAIPAWAGANPDKINLGNEVLSDTARVLLRINMFVGGFVSFFLDNLLPGSKADRGLTAWNNLDDEESVNKKYTPNSKLKTYESTLMVKFLRRFPFWSILPILPRLPPLDPVNDENEVF